MDVFKRIIYTLILLAGMPAVLFAQDPTKDAAEVKKGVLPNSISYYIIPNADTRGRAEYALLQKDNQYIWASRKALRRLPHFTDRSPEQFLRDNGICCTPEGYVSYGNESTLYEFRDIPTADKAVSDSTLLMLFDLAATYDGPQAMIFCGDVDAAALIQKLNILSMVVSRRGRGNESFPYSWANSDLSYSYFSKKEPQDAARFKISYSLQRLDSDKMGTMQAIVAKQYATYFGSILTRRVTGDFRKENIPLASIAFRYLDSSSGPEDEILELEAVTSAAQYEKAIACVAAILASIDSSGVTIGELQLAKDELVFDSMFKAAQPVSDNSTLVRKCCASFLYGAPISSQYAVANFFANTRLSGEMELSLFNNYASALLDSEMNLTLTFEDQFRNRRLSDVFAEGWSSADSTRWKSYGAAVNDTLSLYRPVSKVKLRSSAKDRSSGGSLWTFSNGMKVVYKKSKAKGIFNYAMMIRGGSCSVNGLATGEAAYLADMLNISDIGGMNEVSFHEMLTSNGISLQTNISSDGLCIKGYAPSSRFQLLIHSLLSIANYRSVNEDSYNYYRSTEPLKLQILNEEERDRARLDSLIAPIWKLSAHKRNVVLADNLPQKAEDYFKNQFGHCSDGAIVLVGDLDEEMVKKELCACLGNFRTSKKSTVLPQIRKGYITGHVERRVEASRGNTGVSLAFSQPFEFKMSEYILCRLAETAISEHLATTLSGVGAYASVEGRLELHPETRYNIFVRCTPCPDPGLPEGIESPDAEAIRAAVEDALAEVSATSFNAAALSGLKKRLRTKIESEIADDGKLVDAVAVRYLSGKEIISDYDKALEQIGAAELQNRIKAITGGAKAEYIAL